MASIQDIEVFVVCNPGSNFRKNNMMRRIQKIGLQNRTTFVEGGDRNSELVKYFTGESKGIGGCLIGHLKALRSFVDSKKEWGLILEDDVLFRDDFIEKVIEIIDSYSQYPLIQLFSFTPQNRPCLHEIYGSQGYLLKSSHAIETLIKLDKPTRYWPSNFFKTSEAILMYSGGYCLGADPIIIEDSLTYELSGNGFNPDQTQLKFREYSYKFGLYRYIDCDPDFKITGEIMMQNINYIHSKFLTELMNSKVFSRNTLIIYII
jgi:hypothetical protein